MKKCEHKSLRFLGTQETTIKDSPILLFNCTNCESTIVYTIQRFLSLLLNHNDVHSILLRLSL